MAPHSSTLAWKIPWMEESGRLQSMGPLSQTWLSNFTLTFHFHAFEKEMATHSSVLAWRIPGTVEPCSLPSVRLHRVGHDWSYLAAAAVVPGKIECKISSNATKWPEDAGVPATKVLTHGSGTFDSNYMCFDFKFILYIFSHRGLTDEHAIFSIFIYKIFVHILKMPFLILIVSILYLFFFNVQFFNGLPTLWKI